MRSLNVGAFVQLSSDELGIIQEIKNAALELEGRGPLLDVPAQEVLNTYARLNWTLDTLRGPKMCLEDG